jgi:hypothetical protein
MAEKYACEKDVFLFGIIYQLHTGISVYTRKITLRDEISIVAGILYN